MDEEKICRKCKSKKLVTDFYLSAGRPRSECKACTIKRNCKHQSKMQAWKSRYLDDEKARLYRRAYYHANKEKFAQYRLEFKEKYPEYYKKYFRKKKEK